MSTPLPGRRGVALAAALLALAVGAGVAARTVPPPPVRAGGGVAALELPAASGRDERARWVARAARRGARYVVLPEPPLPPAGAGGEPVPGPTTEFFAARARRLGVWIAVPLLERDTAGGWFVTTVLLDPEGALRSRYRRVMLQGEGARRGSARILATVDDGGHRIAAVAGHDLPHAVPQLAARGAQTILVTAGWGPGEAVDWGETARRLSERYRVTLVIAAGAPADARARGGVFARGAVVARAGREPLVEARVGRPRSPLAIHAPHGLPSVPVPAYDPPTPELVEAGRALFFDRGLSSDGTTSCATCHDPERAFTNGERTGRGVYGRPVRRNVPTLLNVAYRGALFWDGYVATLENQVKYPMSHSQEMDFPYLDQAIRYVRGSPRLVESFRRAGVERDVEFDDVARALAAYQRTLVSGGSRFDRYRYGGDKGALSASERRGLALFTGKAGCSGCHTVGPRDATFMDDGFHNTGIGYRPDGTFSDPGLGLISYEGNVGSFLTPSLRDVARTAPYMHDGSIATLREVVLHYDRGGIRNPLLDPAIRPLGLTGDEVDDLVAFLGALDGGERYDARGERVDPAGTRVAAVQFAPARDAAQGRAELERLVRGAAVGGARLVVVPEHAVPGDARAWPATLKRWGGVARELGIWLAVTAPEPHPRGGHVITTALLDARGELAARQSKLAPHPRRDGGAAEGDPRLLRVVESPAGRVAVLSGDDLERGVPVLAARGATTLLVAASWRRGDPEDRLAVARTLARRHRVSLVVANPAEPGGGAGKTAVIRADGSLAARTADGAAGVVAAAIPRPSPRAAAPLGLPISFHPEEPRAAALGERFFFDPGLSRTGTVSCAHCHVPSRAFADGRRVARGVSERRGQRNVPSLVNVGYRQFLTWDGRAPTLEAQVRHALLGWAEMDSDEASALRHANASPGYRAALRAWTGRDSATFDDVSRALAAYQRTLVSGASPFDRWYFGRDTAAVGPAARRGFALFAGKAKCAGCHTVERDAALFTDQGFHNTGVGYHRRFDYLGYSGDGLESNPVTRNTFRGEYATPSLRGVALTAPYMHDGSIATLADVVRFYDRGGIPNPFLDPAVRPLRLTARERNDLVEFLLTLTGPPPPARSGGRPHPSAESAP